MSIKRRIKRILFIMLVIMAGFYLLTKITPDSMKEMTGGFADAAKDIQPKKIVEMSGKEPIVLFCPRDDCGLNLEYLINKSSKVHCAVFDLDLENVISALQRKDALVVVDGDNYQKAWANNSAFKNFRHDKSSPYMHNKFCIFDDSIITTGSFNPTHNCDEKNNNNEVIIFSKTLAQNYEAEFQELWNGKFGGGEKVKNPVVEVDNITIENYFCPEDFCANHVLEALSKANKSIYFMTFSFTHDKIGDMLVKKHKEGVDVKGVFEKSQESQYSESQKLNQSGIPIRMDTNKAKMHHKVFIIDKEIVVTGSFNPSSNADTENDENIVIIHDADIARGFLQEFEMVWNAPTP